MVRSGTSARPRSRWRCRRARGLYTPLRVYQTATRFAVLCGQTTSVYQTAPAPLSSRPTYSHLLRSRKGVAKSRPNVDERPRATPAGEGSEPSQH
eukprot:7478264-Pyramimonas_sp.AAC.1